MTVKLVETCEVYIGLSADIKPPAPVGARFYEEDTKTMFVRTAGGWVEETQSVKLTGSSVVETTHHNAAIVAADGADADVTGLSTVGLYIFGTSTSRTIQFKGSVDGTNFFDIQAVRYSDGVVATSTTGSGEGWQVDVRGLTRFRVRLDAVAGGNVTVVSKAVA